MEDSSGRFKVGITNNLTKRKRAVETAAGLSIVDVQSWKVQHQLTKLEVSIFKEFASHRLCGEWFSSVDVDLISSIVEAHNGLTFETTESRTEITGSSYSWDCRNYHPIASATHFVSELTGEDIPIQMHEVVIWRVILENYREYGRAGKVYTASFKDLSGILNVAISSINRAIKKFELHGVMETESGSFTGATKTRYINVNTLRLIVKKTQTTGE